MKRANLFSAAIFLTGYFGLAPVSLWGQQGVIYKAPSTGTNNYCHLKFPAIREETLSGDRPVLQDAKSGEIIDFYGPCNFDPLGKEAVQAQRLQWSQRLDREYNN